MNTALIVARIIIDMCYKVDRQCQRYLDKEQTFMEMARQLRTIDVDFVVRLEQVGITQDNPFRAPWLNYNKMTLPTPDQAYCQNRQLWSILSEQELRQRVSLTAVQLVVARSEAENWVKANENRTFAEEAKHWTVKAVFDAQDTVVGAVKDASRFVEKIFS